MANGHVGQKSPQGLANFHCHRTIDITPSDRVTAERKGTFVIQVN